MTGESSQNHSSEEQQGFIYDDPNTRPEQEYVADYVPEREFVLMPLFRRIGDMLGIRRRSEDREHVLPVQQIAPSAPIAEPEPLNPSAAQISDEHELPSPVMHAEMEAPTRPESDVLGIEHEFVPEPASEQPEPVVTAEIQEPVAEPVMSAHEVRAEPEPAIVQHEQIEPELAMGHMAEESVVASDDQRPAPQLELVTRRETRPLPTPARPVLTQEDVAQLIAPITEAAREAATRISAAVSQAAEWLHSKEEEVLRRAEMALESKRADVSQVRAADTPKWESDQTPSLQREAAWLESGGIPVTRTKEALPAERRPVVLKPKRPALWKRIDWAQEFTPKRVAVLGGVAMAMLMIVGVSLARRPASSVLPQQETHVIQPGGVTLTTHPRAIAPATNSAVPHVKLAPQQAAAPRRSSREAAYNEGPEVVTHYYNKQKPSPAHQSTTVAGVKHYSDM